MKCIGIDYGTKRIGIAKGDTELCVALPHDVVPSSEALTRVCEIIESEGARVVVVGDSRDYAGGHNAVSEEIARFIEALSGCVGDGVNIVLEDERYTTRQARTAPQLGMPRGETTRTRNKAHSGTKRVDAHAAALILQTYLDKSRRRV